MPRLRRTAAALLLLAACARQGVPPGGPADAFAPVLLGTIPDSIAGCPDHGKPAEFRFNEVINEGSQPNFGNGNGDLEKLVLLSPDTLVPQVGWHRSRISVKPRHGWAPNTVYRIELTPGVRDLSTSHTNEVTVSHVITCYTGPAAPRRYISGRVIDWMTQRSVPLALIQADHLPEHAVYRAVTDSLGRFHFGPLPDGVYLVGASQDNNHDHRRNRDEPWDTVRLAETGDSVGEIWIFPRDTAAARATAISRHDSNTAVFTLSQPVAPDFQLPADSLTVIRLPDSSNVGPVRALSRRMFDSLYPRPVTPPAKADSTAPNDSTAKRDSAAAVAPPPAIKAIKRPAAAKDTIRPDAPAEKRPPLTTELFVRLTGRLLPGNRYLIEARGVRSMGGAVGNVRRVLDIPEVKKPASDSTKARPDSGKARPDSAAAKPPAGGRGGGGGG